MGIDILFRAYIVDFENETTNGETLEDLEQSSEKLSSILEQVDYNYFDLFKYLVEKYKHLTSPTKDIYFTMNGTGSIYGAYYHGERLLDVAETKFGEGAFTIGGMLHTFDFITIFNGRFGDGSFHSFDEFQKEYITTNIIDIGICLENSNGKDAIKLWNDKRNNILPRYRGNRSILFFLN